MSRSDRIGIVLGLLGPALGILAFVLEAGDVDLPDEALLALGAFAGLLVVGAIAVAVWPRRFRRKFSRLIAWVPHRRWDSGDLDWFGFGYLWSLTPSRSNARA